MAGLLEGKAALITGGARGIGRAASLAFAREGARVVVADLLAEGAQETVAMINAGGGQAVSVNGDVTKPAVVKIDRERVDFWMKRGAQPSDSVRTLLARHATPEPAAPAAPAAPTAPAAGTAE